MVNLSRLAKSVYSFARSDLSLLLGMLIIVVGSWAFLKVYDEVVEGDTEHFDKVILKQLSVDGYPRVFGDIARDLTAVGGLPVLMLVTGGVVGYLCIVRRFSAIVLLIVAVGGGLVLSFSLKGLIARPRPPTEFQRAFVMTASFPSAHAMMSAVVYLTLGSLLARLTRDLWLKVYFVGVATVLTGLVGLSRVVLGVHWPTDVLAGWSLGLAWAILCWAVARWLQKRGDLSPPA